MKELFKQVFVRVAVHYGKTGKRYAEAKSARGAPPDLVASCLRFVEDVIPNLLKDVPEGVESVTVTYSTDQVATGAEISGVWLLGSQLAQVTVDPPGKEAIPLVPPESLVPPVQSQQALSLSTEASEASQVRGGSRGKA